MMDYEDEDFYFCGTHVEYAEEYRPEHCSDDFRPEDASEDWSPPREAPSSYRTRQKAPLVALSIPPRVEDPEKRTMALLEEMQSRMRAEFSLDFDPTLYLTLLPRVPGQLYRWINQDRLRDFYDNHTHPGVDIYRKKNDQNEWVYAKASVAPLRFDESWQAVIHFDPAVFATEDWRAGFSEYAIHALYQGELHSVSFQDMHDACPLIGVLIDPGFDSCVGCAHNDIFCRTRFLREALDAVSPDILDRTLWFRQWRLGSGAVSLRGDARWSSKQVSNFLDKIDIDGWYGVSTNAVNAGRDSSISRIKMAWPSVDRQTKKRRDAAKKGAKTRKAHDEVCGRGDEACVLRKYDCMAWRGYSVRCTHRRQHEDELNEEALARLSKMGQKTPVHEIQRSAVLKMNEFSYVADTGRIRTGYFAGVSRPRSQGKVLWRMMRGTQRDRMLYTFPSWEAMRRWFRRWAPWELSQLDEADARAEEIEVSDLIRCVFYAAQSMTSIKVSGGFGGSSYAVECYEPIVSTRDDGTSYVTAVMPQGGGYSLGLLKNMKDFWHVHRRGFTRQDGILPA